MSRSRPPPPRTTSSPRRASSATTAATSRPSTRCWRGSQGLRRSRDRRGSAMAHSRRVRDHAWSPRERAVLIAVLAIAMGSLFLTTYTLALGDPVPRRIDAALVGDAARHASTIEAVQEVADGSLAFRRYGSVPAAREAIDLQRVSTALDVRSGR